MSLPRNTSMGKLWSHKSSIKVVHALDNVVHQVGDGLQKFVNFSLYSCHLSFFFFFLLK